MSSMHKDDNDNLSVKQKSQTRFEMFPLVAILTGDFLLYTAKCDLVVLDQFSRIFLDLNSNLFGFAS